MERLLFLDSILLLKAVVHTGHTDEVSKAECKLSCSGFDKPVCQQEGSTLQHSNDRISN